MDSPGPHRHPGRIVHVVLGRVQHTAPAGRGRLLPEAQEREARLGDHRRGDRERRLHDEGCARCWGRCGEARCAGSNCRRRAPPDVVLDLHGEHLRPREADEHGRGRDADRDHRVGEAGAQERREGDGEDQEGTGEHRVGDARDQHVGPLAEIARERADGHADGKRDGDRDDAGQERGARAPDHAREHVAADLVGSEPVLPPRAPCGSRSSSSRADRTARSTARADRDRDEEERPRAPPWRPLAPTA